MAHLSDFGPTDVSRWISGLQHTGPFAQASRRELAALIADATLLTVEAGTVVCEQGQPAQDFYFVIAGLLDVAVRGPQGDAVLVTLSGHRAYGVEALFAEQPYGASLIALERSHLLRFDGAKVTALRDGSAAFRQGLRPYHAGVGYNDLSTRSAELVTLSSSLPGVPRTALLDLLAQTIVGEFPDRVLIAAPLAPGQPERPPIQGPSGVFVTAIDPQTVDRPWSEFDYVFLDGIAAPSGPRHLELELVFGSPGEPPHRRRLPTVLIDDRVPDRDQPLEGVPGFDVHDSVHRAPCYVRLDLATIQSTWRPGVPLSAFDAGTRDSFARWARAVTQRRVGVALSGGGAWGFFHVVVLRRLVEAGVPIDVVSSASMGSAIGAYFAARGLPGLDQLLEFSTRRLMNLDWMAAASMFSSAAMQWAMHRQLGGVLLQQLPTRFHPVTTNLSTGRCFVATKGSLAVAVRASASAPGVWGPTLLGGSHFVDGCVTDNLPACVLPLFGADLTFGCNCYPYGVRDEPRFTGKLATFFHEINPIGRFFDLACSGSLMLHRAGQAQGESANVFYDAKRADDPLLGAMSFRKAQQFIDDAESDPLLAAKIELFIDRWRRLKQRGALPGQPSLAR